MMLQLLGTTQAQRFTNDPLGTQNRRFRTTGLASTKRRRFNPAIFLLASFFSYTAKI